MDAKAHAFATRAVHAGHDVDPTGAHATPIHATSTFVYGDAARGRRLFAGEEPGYVYGRIGNPTTRAFERRVASLEGGADAVAFASGMGAIAGLLLTVLAPGDEVVVLGPLYGGTGGLLHDLLARYGVRTNEAGGGPDRSTADRLAEAVGPRTKMIYVESPTNPTLNVHDLDAVAAAGRTSGALTVADNTFATPYLTRPLEHGLDVVLHSATKYLGGHGDALGGVLVASEELVAQVRAEGLRHVGAVLGPFEAFLLLRGLATLHLRVAAQCTGARRVAEAVRDHPAVARVHYPGFTDHPGHAVAERQMRDFGGMVALELAGEPALATRRAHAFLDRLELFAQAVSLGDVASLATHPATTTHELWTPEQRSALGVDDALVRLSVGVEDPDDLVADVRRALDAAAAVAA